MEVKEVKKIIENTLNKNKANNIVTIDLKKKSFAGFIERILDLRSNLSIPHTLKELNVDFDFYLLYDV